MHSFDRHLSDKECIFNDNAIWRQSIKNSVAFLFGTVGGGSNYSIVISLYCARIERKE